MAGAGPPPLRLPLRRVVSAVPCGGPAGRAVVMAAFSGVGVGSAMPRGSDGGAGLAVGPGTF